MSTETQDHVFGYVLEVLTTGLYPNNLDVIREYVQNGYDAILSLRRLGIRGPEQIHIKIEDDSLTIYDTGIGMDRDIVEKYKYFGYSEKITTKNTGFRGIGKLAGLSVARDLEVITSKYGVPYQYTVRFMAKKMLDKILNGKKQGINYPLNQLIQEYTTIEEAPEEADAHYTTVTLLGVKEEAQELLEESTLKEYLSQVVPIEFDNADFKFADKITQQIIKKVPGFFTVDVLVNNHKIYKPFSDNDGLSGLTFYPVYSENSKGKKQLQAFAWAMRNGNNSKAIGNDLIKNLRVVYKGFMIGSRELLTSVLFSPGRQFTAAWFTGEVYVLDEELIPTSARDQFESNAARKLLFENLREQIGKQLDKEANAMSGNNSLKNEVDKSKELLKKLEKVVAKKNVPRELISAQKKELEIQVEKLEKKVKTNKSVASNENVKKVNDILQRLHQQKEIIQDVEKNHDSQEQINFSSREKKVYEIATATIKSFFQKQNLKNEEELISELYKKLIKAFGTK